MELSKLKGVGPRTISLLEKVSIHCVQDLLFHLPLRYEDRTQIHAINTVKADDHVMMEGVIVSSQIVYGKRRSLLCRVADDTGQILLRFFYFSKSQADSLSKVGEKLRCFGEVRGFAGHLEVVHPEYRHFGQFDSLALEDRLTPVYPATKGLQQATFRKLTSQALSLLDSEDNFYELLPEYVLQHNQLMTLKQALLFVHRPPVEAPKEQLKAVTHPAQKRLAFEELMAHQLGLQKLRHQIRQYGASVLTADSEQGDDWQQILQQQLPFILTNAQQRVVKEINQDLQSGYPMLRLVQGDVGSGKTVVAAMAIVRALQQGKQAALMAPTEILAEQHLKAMREWFEPMALKVGWLAGAQTAKERRESLEKILSGEYQLVVGTHALFQGSVVFSNLALLVVDEQHKFGVHQRLALKEKGVSDQGYPHQLIMTATPIPRTLAMTAYADLDTSVIDELPPGRKPIKTVLLSSDRRAQIIERIKVNCGDGRQAYWVCTLIEDSDVLQAQAAEVLWQQLCECLPELKVGLIHGRLKSAEKETMMSAFKAKEIHLLVATTVIEVGVDVPNASLMIIDNPERLGLAQLHQLRGRVGRGTQESFCVLLYQKPLSVLAKQRLHVMQEHQDGFAIAREDLRIRGPGEVLGTRQTGLMRFKVADLIRDREIIPSVQEASRALVETHPDAVDLLIQRWLINSDKYAGV